MKKTLNNLRQDLKEVEQKAEMIKEDIAQAQRKLSDQQKELSKYFEKAKYLKQQLRNYSGPPPIHVTDHAIVRYLERVKGITRAELEAEVIDDKGLELIYKMQAADGKYPVKDFQIVLNDCKVRTVLPPNN